MSYLLFGFYPFEKINHHIHFHSGKKQEMENLNFRLAEEKNFHSEVLLFAFNPEHDIIVICSANGDVKSRCFNFVKISLLL